MKPRYSSRVELLALALVLAAAALLGAIRTAPVMAQATTGTITGTTVDSAAAAIPDATVVAKNQETGVSSPAYKSTKEGVFVIPNLSPGKYTVTVESQNFKRAVYTDLEVRLGTTTALTATLQPGGVSETVTVTAGAETAIQTESSQISASFEARKVQELPSNIAGGGIDTLALLAPGIVPGLGFSNTNGTSFSVNGNRERANNFSIDGQDNNDLSVGGPNYFVSNQDLVQDFQIVTNNFSAQYGRNQGAVVNIVTKGGTNDFHGSAFEYHRDRNLLDSKTNREALDPNLKDGPPPLLYNVFGGTLGGPIKKDRAFFFGSFQGIRTRETQTLRSDSLAILPEELPRLKAAFPGNAAVAALADFSAFAIPNVGTVRPRGDLPGVVDTVTIGGQSFRAAFPERVLQATSSSPFRQDEFTARGDVKISEKDSVWARYLYQDGNFKNALASSNGFTGDLPARSQNLGSTYTRQISSRSVNEFRFAYTRLFVKFGGGCDTGSKGCIPDPLDIGKAFANLSFAGILGDDTGASLQTIGPATNLPQGRLVEVLQFADNYSFVLGRHSFVAGVDIRRLNNKVPFLPNDNGQFNVSTAARLVANAPLRVTLAAGQDTVQYRETDQFYFFQDDWKVRDNLTLNLGVRYENTGQPINTLNQLTTSREQNQNTAIWRQNLPLNVRTVPNVPTDNNNVAPRIGFAYTPRFWSGFLGQDATVVRGGFSIAYDPGFYNILLNVSTSTPTVFNNVTSNSTAAPTFPVPDPNPTGDKVRAFAQTKGLIATNTFDPRFFTQTIVAPNFHSPYAMQWSLGIQRQVNRNNVFEACYVATRAVGLFQNINANPQFDKLLNGFSVDISDDTTFNFPGFPNLVPKGAIPLGSDLCTNDPATLDNEGVCFGRLLRANRILSRENNANSIYHSLQTRYNGRVFNQLTLGGAYTFSKSIDNASEIFFGFENSTSQAQFDNNQGQRGLSAIHRPHVFSLNGLWDIPGFKDQKGVLGHLLGGWQINSVYLISSGQRFTPSQFFNSLTTDTYVDVLGGDVLRPFAGNPKANPQSVGITVTDAILFGLAPEGASSPTGLFSFNEINANQGNLKPVTLNDVRVVFNGPGAAVMFNTPFGNVGRNSFAGPRINQLNTSFFKNIAIKERLKMQFRTELFNLFNHPNPGYGFFFNGGSVPDSTVEDAGISGSAFNNPKDIEFNRRIIQFGLRLSF